LLIQQALFLYTYFTLHSPSLTLPFTLSPSLLKNKRAAEYKSRGSLIYLSEEMA
jgi:hypothetical protein